MDSLAKLLAIEEIRQLKARYFRFVDTRDFASLEDLFCEQAVFDASDAARLHTPDGDWIGSHGPVVSGRTKIIAWIAASYVDRVSVHHGHDHEIYFDSDVLARGIVAMEDRIRRRDLKTRLIEAQGYYHEIYRFERGAWKIASTKLTRIFRDICD